MPTDFKNLSINNLIKLQYPSQILSNENLLKPYFNIGVVESSSSCMSNVVGSNNLPIMSELSDQNNLKTRLCSEDDSNSNDSELSVGQEKVHNEQSESKNNKHNNNNNNVNSSSNNNNSKESIDSDDDDEEMSNASSSQYTTSSTRLCSPQQNTREIGDMMRPIQFHEEILRSSQLYAEEILRQRIAAAARLQSATDPKNHSNSLDEPEPSIISKLNFQTGLFSASKLTSADNGSNENGNNIFSAKSAINFQNIHSHLSAISQITNSLGSNNMKKDDTTSLSSLSRESSQSPSGFQQFNKQQHHHHNLHHHHHHNHHQPKHDFHATHQNQLHEHNLKFSIDNILKADFGRRITEPLLKTSRLKRSSKHHQQHQHEKEKINNSFTTVDTLQKEPHNSSVTKDKSIDQTFSSSTETSSKSDAGTSTSPGGTVWPAWVKYHIFYIYLLLIHNINRGFFQQKCIFSTSLHDAIKK